ncbi:substrate-binding domain-containing protein [Nocardioides hungaricus]
MTAALDGALLAPPSQADDEGTLTVVGTSDVFDSNLVQTIIEPGFEAAFPQYDLQYVSRGTGAAIAYAKAGTASALIVHAAALENQFVADGYSLEPFGRAIFWGDYVLLGPEDDPAGVMDGDSTFDIREAFEKVAAAGEAGKANFISRGGTPGTTVQEHAIWAQTTGVQTCDVSAANGGGTSPSTSTGACSTPIALPDWYQATGLTQGPNIINGDACNYDGGGCYVFTDRGTFQYLESTGAVSNLEIVTRPDAQGDTALSNLLVNSFHAYGLNPAAFDDPDVNINTAAATAFLDWITSPETQQKIGSFLYAETAGDPPFLPSAAPEVTITSDLPDKVDGGKKITVSGTLTNAVPGTPALSDVPVKLMARPAAAPGATPTPVAAGRTDENGAFRIRYAPRASQILSIEVEGFSQVVDDSLDPIFGDILQGTSVDAGRTRVVGTVSIAKRRATADGLAVSGKLRPAVIGAKARVVLYAGHPGRKLKQRGSKRLADGATSYSATFKLGSGTWNYQLRYVNDGVILAGKSATKQVSLP